MLFPTLSNRAPANASCLIKNTMLYEGKNKRKETISWKVLKQREREGDVKQSDFRSSLCHEFNRRDLVVVYVFQNSRLGEPFGVERVSVVLL